MYTEKQEYITNKQHSIFPAGTKCWISREYADSPLKIEFDGLIIFSNCYAKNIEEQLSPIERQIKESRWTIIEKITTKANNKLKEQEDNNTLEALEKAFNFKFLEVQK